MAEYKLGRDAIIDQMKAVIGSALDKIDRASALEVLSGIAYDYGLPTAANLLRKNCEPFLDKQLLEEGYYTEGDEDAGFVALSMLLQAVEKIINCDSYSRAKIQFQYFVRPESPEEAEEAGRLGKIDWWVKDETHDVRETFIQFRLDWGKK